MGYHQKGQVSLTTAVVAAVGVGLGSSRLGSKVIESLAEKEQVL